MPLDVDELVAELTQRADEIRTMLPELAALDAAIAVLRGDGPDARAEPSRRNRGRILAAVQETPASQAPAIARRAGVTPTTARKHLSALLADGQVSKDERGRWLPT